VVAVQPPTAYRPLTEPASAAPISDQGRALVILIAVISFGVDRTEETKEERPWAAERKDSVVINLNCVDHCVSDG
jgi:hypothetical protein